MNLKSKLLIPRILFYWIIFGILTALSIIPYSIVKAFLWIVEKIVMKIEPRRLPGITPKLTKNKIVRLYARKEGIQSIKIDGVRDFFKED